MVGSITGIHNHQVDEGAAATFPNWFLQFTRI
jgi:hypothetical protein